MWNNTVTLYIDDTSIRLLAARGQKVKKWADVKLEPGLITNSVVVKEDEVAVKIKQLFKDQGITAKKVALGHSGLHSLTRPVVLPDLNKAMLAEAVIREARRVLPIPLDQLYVSWKTYPSPKGRVQAFIAATPRKTVDSLIKTLQKAGLEPSHMTIRSLALTKAIHLDSAIVVDLQPTEFDIIIVSEGIPQPIRTISLPNQELDWEQKLDMIVSDLDRTIKFFDTNNPEKSIDPKSPVYVSGELMDKAELHQSLSQKLNRPIKTLYPVLKTEEQINLGRYIVNIAMTIDKAIPGREGTFQVANMNLLPSTYQTKSISPNKLLAIPAGAAALGIIITLVLMAQSASASVDSLKTQLNGVNRIINTRTVQKTNTQKNATAQEKQISALQSEIAQLKMAQNSIVTQQEWVNNDLKTTLSKLVPEIIILEVTESNGVLTIKGIAPADEIVRQFAKLVLDYGERLDGSKRFMNTVVTKIENYATNTEETSSPDNSAPSVYFELTLDRG